MFFLGGDVDGCNGVAMCWHAMTEAGASESKGK